MFSRARNCTIRPAGPGAPRAVSPPHAIFTRRRCCPTARCWWQAVMTASSRERGTVRSGERDLERHGQPQHGTLCSHGDVAAQRQGAGGRGMTHGNRERGTLRSGERDLDGYRQPRTDALFSHGDVAAQRQGARRRRFTTLALSRARNCTIRRAGPGAPRAASTPHGLCTRRPCCPTEWCSSQAVMATGSLSRERGTLYSRGTDRATSRW